MPQDRFLFPLTDYAVTGITGVWKMSKEAHHQGSAHSLPGHLLHLIIEGAYHLTSNGRSYPVRAGDVIYYHDTESVFWDGGALDVTFYSVGFYAPGIPPLAMDARTFRATAPIKRLFSRLYEQAQEPLSPQNSLRMYSLLLDLLSQLGGFGSETRYTNDHARLWWEIEEQIRRDKQFRATAGELSTLSGRSQATVSRACKRATGLSPIERLRAIRMAEAQGLLDYSTMNISEIAQYLGYPRIHEFSREFSRYVGISPTARRQAGTSPRT